MLKENKKIFLYITYACFILFILFKYNSFIILLQNILVLINPIIYGFIISYFLNLIMKRLDRKIKNRKVNIFLSILIILLVITLTISFLIPQIVNNIDILSKKIPKLYLEYKSYIIDKFPIIQKINTKKILKYIKNNYNGTYLTNLSGIKNIFFFFSNIFLGIIIAIIMLYNKEKIIFKTKEILKRKLNKRKYDKIVQILRISNKNFEKYFIDQLIISLFIGILTFIGMLILKIPYQYSISTFIFVLSLIPTIGLIIGVIISSFLLISISLRKTIYFLILIFIIKQLSDLFIRQKVLEKELKVNGILIFIAVIYFTINFGLIGAIISVPLTSTIYEIIKKRI